MAKRKKTEPEPTVESEEENLGLLAGQVCRRLTCSKRKLRSLVDEGRLTVTNIEGVDYYEPDEIAELLEEGFTGNKKDVAFDQTVKALKDSHEHLNRFVALTVDPLQKINDALLSENQSLRAQQEKLYTELRQVNELYGALQRETLENEITARKEQLNIEQRQEAFALLKNQLMPAILDNMSARRILTSLDDDMFDTLLASGLLNPEQTAFVSAYVKRRKESAEKAVTDAIASEGTVKNGSSKPAAES